MKLVDHDRLVINDGYPVIPRLNGFALQLEPKHIEEVEKLVSMGASKRYVARALLCSERELEKAIICCPALEEAINRGVAADEFELAGKLRSMAMDGELGALSLYLKAKHGWREKDSAASGSGPQININITGLLDSRVAIEQPKSVIQDL